jgi:hypothetical protein
MIGCGIRGTEVVRRGMMCGLCVPCGVADGRGHAAVYRQSERTFGMRAGLVGRGGGDQPGDGGLCRLDGMRRAEMYDGGMHSCITVIRAVWAGLDGMQLEALGVRWAPWRPILVSFALFLMDGCSPWTRVVLAPRATVAGTWLVAPGHLLQSKPSRCCSGTSLSWC